MLRKELELKMKEKGITQIDLILNENDKLAVYCSLKAGGLKDYTDHVIDRNQNIWGYLFWKDGKSYRIPFERS